MGAPSVASPDPLLDLDSEELRRLLRLSHELNATLDLPELLRRIIRLVLSELSAEAGSVWLREGDVVRCHVCEGDLGDALVGVELPLGAGVVGSVVVSGEPTRIEDPLSDPRFLHQIDEATGFRTGSMLAVPLISKGEVLGAIQISNRRGDGEVFTEAQLTFLLALADDAAAAIRNSRAFEAEQRSRDLKALLRLSHDLAATLDRERILATIVNLAGDTVPYDRCILALWEDGEPRVGAVSGEEQVERKSASMREVEGFLRWAGAGDGVWIPDIDDADDVSARAARERFPAYLRQSGARGLLVRPIEDPEGRMALLLFEFERGGFLTEWQLEAADLIVAGARLALRNAELYAGLPFISVLEPVARARRSLALLPRRAWVRYGLLAAAVVIVLSAVHVPVRIAAEEATVRAAMQRPARATVAGTLEAIHVREGQSVAAGDVLARVRDEELLLRVRGAQADVESAQRAALAAAAAGDAAALAQARVAGARAQDELRLLESLARRSDIVAPAAGEVLTPRLQERIGSHVDAGAVVAWIGDADWVEIQLLVPQQDIGDVSVGDRVRARVPAYPSVTFSGRVTMVAPRAHAEEGVPVYAVRAILDNRDRLLMAGMHARAKVLTSPRPLAAMLFRRPWRWLRMNSWWILPV